MSDTGGIHYGPTARWSHRSGRPSLLERFFRPPTPPAPPVQASCVTVVNDAPTEAPTPGATPFFDGAESDPDLYQQETNEGRP